MAKSDIDNTHFPGDSRLEFVTGFEKKPLYKSLEVTFPSTKGFCTAKRSCLAIVVVLILIFIIALTASLSRTSQCKHKHNADLFPLDSDYPDHEHRKFFAQNGFRLPSIIEPILYNVTISPEWTKTGSANFFKGRVFLTFRALANSDFLVLNNKDLRFTRVELNILLPSEIPTIDARFGIPVTGLTYDDEVYEMVKIDLKSRHENIWQKFNDPNHIGKKEGIEVGTSYLLDISYYGNISKNMNGLYSSSYTDSVGQEHYLLSTQFEPNYARRAFPCLDEPAFKAHFSISMDRPRDLLSLSNMPLQASRPVEPENGLVRDYFQQSVKMSTYLVAFVICDFKMVSGKTISGTLVGVHAPAEQIDQAIFAKDVAIKALDFYEKYFDIPFPLPKTDLIGIPDFSAGAMENWGLITYRMVDLLYKPNVTSESQKERVAIVITHELAHQWFGNLVTMSWWDDLWLNEGFATYMEYVCAGAIFPEWQMLDKYAPDTAPTAHFLDALVHSHPVSHAKVESPSDMQAMFDAISYNKGSLLLRMLDGIILDKEVFRMGLQKYLKDHQYGNAQSIDLWRGLQQAFLSKSVKPNSSDHSLIWAIHDEGISSKSDDIDIAFIMNGWVTQKGYPLITVSDPVPLPDMDGTYTIDIYQTKFGFKYGEEPIKLANSISWQVPFTLLIPSKNLETSPATLKYINTTIWLKNQNISHPLTNSLKPDWLKGNLEYAGYYYVTYGPKIWENLVQDLKSNADIMSSLDRTQLIINTFSLARFGHISFTQAFDFVIYINPKPFSATFINKLHIGTLNEKSEIPLMTIIETLSTIRSYFGYYFDSESKVVYQKLLPAFIYKLLLNELLDKFDVWKNGENLSHLQIYLQGKVINMAVSLGHKPTILKARPYFEQWIHQHSNSKTHLPFPDLSSAILRSGIEHGTVKDWELAWKAYKASNVPSEKIEILYALAYTSDEKLLERLLSLVLAGLNPPISPSGDLIRAQDATGILSRISAWSPIMLARTRVWTLLRRHWDEFSHAFGDSTSSLDGLVKGVCKSFDSPALLVEFNAFFRDTKKAADAVGQDRLGQLREIIVLNIAFAEKQAPGIVKWLKEKNLS